MPAVEFASRSRAAPLPRVAAATFLAAAAVSLLIGSGCRSQGSQAVQDPPQPAAVDSTDTTTGVSEPDPQPEPEQPQPEQPDPQTEPDADPDPEPEPDPEPPASSTTSPKTPVADGPPDTTPISPWLTELRVTGANEMMPAFSPEVFHYAVRCAQEQTLEVSASAAGDEAVLMLNGAAAPGRALTNVSVRLADDEDVVVELHEPGTGEHPAYVVHCVPEEFPGIEVVRNEAGTSPGLMLVTPYFNPSNTTAETASWLAMVDNNGVARFTRPMPAGAHNFRWHEQSAQYSYNEARPNNSGPVVLLDENLEEVDRLGTVAGLAPPMMHEFLITDEGNYLFISRTPAVRDLSRYPAHDDQPQPSDAQATHDDIIQEVSPDGREVFRWNSWDHLKLSDCASWPFFPEEYAKINSLNLDEQGNIVASFRGCSQALKIERPSGRVLWQLGGSDPAAPDVHDARRPTFERAWHRPAEDPRDGFCAQHTVLHPAPQRVVMFDNGNCEPDHRESSRVVEYRLDDSGDAVFVGHHEPGPVTFYGGAVALLDNGNQLISWGGGSAPASVTEIDPAGRELFALRFFRDLDPALVTYRVWRHADVDAPLRPPRP